MPYILGVLQEEYERLTRQRKIYSDILKDLPRVGGSIVKKEISHNIYYYFAYREGKQVKTDYIKKENLEEFKEKLKERDRVKKVISNIDIDLKIIERTLKREKVLKWFI